MGPIVLFDGVCNFCNSAVNFIIRHDPEKKFHFAALQSESGDECGPNSAFADDVDSIILIDDDRAYMHSTAGLRIAKHLGGIWSLGYAAIIVPAFIRDWIYRLFARNIATASSAVKRRACADTRCARPLPAQNHLRSGWLNAATRLQKPACEQGRKRIAVLINLYS